MVRTSRVRAFTSGIHNKLDSEVIPDDAASDSLGWFTRDGHIELTRGRQAVGAEGTSGRVVAEHTGFRVDGTAVKFRKIWNGTTGKVQYFNGTSWADTITGLSNSEVTFANYASLAGNVVYLGDPIDGLFKICTANPGSYATLYNSAKNFKGHFFIDKGRSYLWGVTKDPSGLYGSYIDSQDSDVYTTVAGEALLAVESGTLAFKAGGATRTCFGVVITDTSSGEVFTDNYNGVLVGSGGTNTGTINYMTGAFTITGQTGAGTATYQWEDSNAKGVTDFSKSATRLAGEGFTLRQDIGGDAIKVVIPHEGSYFSIKENSVYKLTMDSDDLNPDNQLIRTGIGVKTLRGAIGTSAGIMIMDTGNPSEPDIILLQKNPYGDNFITPPVFPHFKFSKYNYDDVALFNWDKFVVVACKENADDNNRVLLGDFQAKTVDVMELDVRCFTQDDGVLYGGSPVVTTSYELFTGFDDMGQIPSNFWISKEEQMGDPVLKKVKKLRYRGQIAPDQKIKVSVATEGGVFQHVGTILGSGDYVDYSSTFAVGTSFIGQENIGGGSAVSVYNFHIEMKVRFGKFRVRRIKFEAIGSGYCSITEMTDFDIWLFQEKIPARYRIKQNVSLDGEDTDQNNP